MQQLHISKIRIENYRNFSSVDFNLSDKQVIIGENNVGKSNLLRAIQLILDPSFSDEDRQLDESDFFEGLSNPLENQKEIRIDIYINNYIHIKNILCQLCDATVDLDGQKVLQLTYKFYPKNNNEKNIEYNYIIFKGNDETRLFTYEDRKYLNIKVIKGIRDVESEMRNPRSSPLTKLINQKYKIDKDDIKHISEELRIAGANTINLPELVDLKKRISKVFNEIIAYSKDKFDISLKTIDIDATRILHALKPLINMRESSCVSLGINNILYISLMLLLIEDDTIKTYISKSLYDELTSKKGGDIIPLCYSEKKSKDGYILNKENNDHCETLYDFMYEHNPSNLGVTILAIEEPEAHIHPIFQRLLYKYIANTSYAPVIITTHSTVISSVAPITSIIHLVSKESGTSVHTTANISLSDKEKLDISRYIDVKRGEIYLAKGIIYVEGVAEEYLIPSFAQAQEIELDRYGIVVCNINSTNFIPYKKFSDLLNIPSVIITDGDYYHFNGKDNVFGEMHIEGHEGIGYAGNERALEICKLFLDDKIVDGMKKSSWKEQDDALAKCGFFVGLYTLEIDILGVSNDADKNIICTVFNDLTNGGQQQQNNFKENLNSNKYCQCLGAIESSHSQIGKGRFAQRLASVSTKTMVPKYISDAIQYICEKVGRKVE